MPKNRFILIVLIILSIFIVVGLLVNKMSNRYSGPPVLTVSEEIGDLGSINSDKPQSHIFTLKNEGGELLIIERVQAPCSCTATVLEEEKLLPGKTTQLEVTFNPKGYEGEITQSVYIYSNDPENSRKRITIKANIEHSPSPKITLSISRWELGLLSKGDKSVFQVTLSNNGDLILEIENIVLPNEVHYSQETPEFPIQIAPDETRELSFVYDSSNQEMGVITAYIRLVTNDPNKKNITLRIEGYIKEKEETISILPLDKFILTGELGNQAYQAKLLIKNNSDKEWKQISLIPSQDYITLDYEKINLSPREEKGIIVTIKQKDYDNIDIKEEVQECIYVKIPILVNIVTGNPEQF